MAEPHVITALAKKRAELSGDIETTQAKLRQMILDLESLDKTLLMFDPDYRIETIRPKAFRPPEESMTSSDIAVQLIAERALDQTDAKLQRLMTKRVGVEESNDLEDADGHDRSLRGCLDVPPLGGSYSMSLVSCEQR
jgi:hypothetical protein